MPSVLLWTSCGTQRLLRPLSGPCILLATAPTAPPCIPSFVAMRHLPPAGGSLWPQAAVVAVAISAENLFLFAAQKNLRIFLSCFFTEGVVTGSGICCCRPAAVAQQLLIGGTPKSGQEIFTPNRRESPAFLGEVYIISLPHSNTLCTGNTAQKGEPPIGRLACCVLWGNFISPE